MFDSFELFIALSVVSHSSDTPVCKAVVRHVFNIPQELAAFDRRCHENT
jgi:hypothetical protein